LGVAVMLASIAACAPRDARLNEYRRAGAFGCDCTDPLHDRRAVLTCVSPMPRRARVVAALVSAAGLVACSDRMVSMGEPPLPPQVPDCAELNCAGSLNGQVRIGLSLANNGDWPLALTYHCTGPSAIPDVTFTLQDAGITALVIGGIHAGAGYECTFMGTDDHGDPCTGTSTTFDVVARNVADAAVRIACFDPDHAAAVLDASLAPVLPGDLLSVDSGPVFIPQMAYSCPGITAFSGVPAVQGTQPAPFAIGEIGSMGLAPDGGTATSNVFWSASCTIPPCGTFMPSPNRASPSFVCGPTPQQVTVTARVTNFETNATTGVTTDVCQGQPFTTTSATLDCEHAAEAGASADAAP
jgi:hypothetical protein